MEMRDGQRRMCGGSQHQELVLIILLLTANFMQMFLTSVFELTPIQVWLLNKVLRCPNSIGIICMLTIIIPIISLNFTTFPEVDSIC